ncbi:MAG: hypothetical protein M3Y80_03500 [Verrucomicrobiota bacterium]|nr:hypothetical protein [Verrucomicrobiota bacterium]
MTLFLIGWITVGLADQKSSIKFASPDGRFGLRISEDLKVDLIETTSDKVMVDLGKVYGRYLDHPEETVLVWSADSKWAAYGTRGDREGDATVYFWNGSGFEAIRLPDDLPGPNIKFRKGSGAMKNYGGSVMPLRWLKSGELELSSRSMMLSRDDGATYSGAVVITVGFDAQHHVLVKKIGKTKTEVSG